MQLRPYQQQAIDAVVTEWSAGRHDTLLVAATGAGKTNMFLRLLMDELDRDPSARALIFAHRTELIDQPLERVRHIDPAWLLHGALTRPRIGVIQAQRQDHDRQLTIATVQSLRPQRLASLLAHGAITHLVIDEAHHAVAASYLRIYEALRNACPDLRHLGVTATPLRADGDGLARLYQSVAAKITIADLVRQHYLVQPRWLAISTGISISGVHTRGGDYVASELADRFDTPAGRRIVVAAYQQYASDRRAIAFTASVAGAHALADDLRAVGITAAAVDGTTPADERARILGDFRAGRLQVVANCEVLTEGFDAPGTSCILMCRPTRSDSAYIQKMGRGLRPAPRDDSAGMAIPGEDCLILDFMPADTRNIVMAGDVLGIPRAQSDAVRELLAEKQGQDDELAQLGFTFDGEAFDYGGTPLEIVARQLDYLQSSSLAWFPPRGVRRPGDVLTVGLGLGEDRIDRILVIRDGALYGVGRPARVEGAPYPPWRVRPIPCDDPYAEAERVAARHGVATLMRKASSWRGAGISDGQQRYLQRLARGRLSLAEIRLMDKGTAAQWITHLQAEEALRHHATYAAAELPT